MSGEIYCFVTDVIQVGNYAVNSQPTSDMLNGSQLAISLIFKVFANNCWSVQTRIEEIESSMTNDWVSKIHNWWLKYLTNDKCISA